MIPDIVIELEKVPTRDGYLFSIQYQISLSNWKKYQLGMVPVLDTIPDIVIELKKVPTRDGYLFSIQYQISLSNSKKYQLGIGTCS